MEIQLNGEAYEVEAGCTISKMLEGMGLAGKRIAIEYNQDILLKSEHEQTTLQANDRVEVVHAIGGG
ncbi:thiamine biosynthesis protein ThiS [Motiliproteus sp. MSK22-1]|nr:sulfur carrier protein ThiS [Motiliproteus sp. MSK22-1]OMH39708.1 thiamine biosynthesis protein ThiS [Motiliproteus sp. MSK22-1]